MTLPSLYEYLGTPALEPAVDVSTARTASVEGVDPPGGDGLGVPFFRNAGSYQTRSDAETYDDHASAASLGIPASDTELSRSDGETYDSVLVPVSMEAARSICMSTVLSKADSETFDEDTGRGGLGVLR